MKLERYPRFLFFLIMIISVRAAAQDQEIRIADEYYKNQEWVKARDSYEKLGKKTENLPLIYQNYLNSLLYTKTYDDAEKLVRRMVKINPENVYYRCDEYIVTKKISGQDKADKVFQNLASDLKNNLPAVDKAGDYLIKAGEASKAKDLYLISRKAINKQDAYAPKLAAIYKAEGNLNLMVEELLIYVKNNPDALEDVKNTFQNQLVDKDEFGVLENALYEKVQKDPDEIVYNEILLWLNIQLKNFNKAFLQAKAIDKRNKLQGNKLIEVGKIALENKDYDNAIRYFQYVVDEYPNGYNYPTAKRLVISTKEEIVKNTYPVQEANIRSLITDYRNLVKEMGKTQNGLEAMRNMALLYAFYVDNKDSAITLLQDVIDNSRADERFKNKAKLDLGDIYLLKGEPWESTLIYSQVEKAMKEDVLGHEAKLRNAKLNYYKGEFELAQEHLDILKLATSREIANDAMDLSILIQDNIGLDTTMEAMKEYASIDLLLFQNKIEEALRRTDEMLVKYPHHSLTDEIYWLQYKLYLKKGDYNQAAAKLEKVLTTSGDDILGDNALYALGQLYEFQLKDKAKAMEYYQMFLRKYPGSIFTSDARKRYRILRGDKI